MPSGQLRNEVIRDRLRSAPDDYELQCASCGDKSQLQDCPRTGSGIGYCCPNCAGLMRCISFIPNDK